MYWVRTLRGILASIGLLVMTPSVVAAPVSVEAEHFHVVWAQQSDLLPSLQPAMNAPFRLKRSPNGFTAAAPDAPAMRTTLASLDRHSIVRIDDAGLEAVAQAIRDRVEEAGLMGVTVSIAWSPDPAAAGRDRGEVWMIVSAPLPGAAVNSSLPADLVTLGDLRIPTIRIEHIDLSWQGSVPHLPRAAAFLDQVKVPIRVRGGRVLPASASLTTVGRLRRMPPLEWSPAALESLDEAMQSSMVRLGDDVSTTVTHTSSPTSNGGEDLHFVAQVVAVEPAAMKVAQEPSESPVAESAAEPLVTAQAPTAMPVPIGTPVDQVVIVWGDGADREWGSPALLFSVTLVHLRQVEDFIQAGSPESTQPLLVTNLGDMQGLRWRPSATRVLLQAMQSRLADLGMDRTTLSHEFTLDGRRNDPKRVLRIAVHVPPRADDMPAITKAHEMDGERVYPVWPFEVGFFSPHPELPAVSTFMRHPIELVAEANEWNAMDEDSMDRRVTVTLGELNESGPMAFSASAIQSINKQLGAILTGDGLLGVRVAPSSDQIVSTGENAGTDLRSDTLLQLGIDVGRVAEIRTLAAGDRIDTEERVGHESHQTIASGSPLKTAEDNENSHGDLLRQEQLDDYLYFLSRHPGRDVEASVASSQFVGGISLEYTISESKPWTAWFQYGNIGTKSEDYQRYRWGFYTTQLTGNDDIFSLQYVTSNFSDTNAVMGSYEAPIGLDGRLRAGINGSWSQYFADQFGFGAIVSDAISGTSWSGAGELRWNAYQDGPLFVDVVGGLRLQHLSTTNTLFRPRVFSDQASFLIPYGMLRAEKTGNWSQIDATVGLEGNVLSHSQQTLEVVGLRGNPADKWIRFNGILSGSTYLEPLLDPAGWADPSTPKSSTLAHEIYGRISGQYSFGSRLMPQFQDVVGGPDTNRGYPVYVVAGDDVLNLTGEYRFHLPRTFDPDDSPGTLLGEPFRMAPQYVYGRPDWDLVLLGFVDASWVRQSGNNFLESNDTLVSVGLGLDLTLKTNMRIRLDWGVALKSLQNRSYDAGQNRLYVQASLYF